MKIDQEDFEEALGIAYRKGCARQQTICPCNEEIREVILDVYDLLKYDITTSEPSVEADGLTEWVCPHINTYKAKCLSCGEQL